MEVFSQIIKLYLGYKNHKNCKLSPACNLHITPFVYNVFLDIKIAEENAELAEFIAETEKVSFSKTYFWFVKAVSKSYF